MKVKCSHQKMVPIAELRQKFHPKNRNEHPPEQIERLAKILEFQGIRRPVQLSNLSGKVVVGHGMILAAEFNGWTELPVDYQDYSDADQEYAHVQADNAIASWAELNLPDIQIDVKDLNDQFDWDMLGLKSLAFNSEVFEPQADEDEVPEHVEPKTRLGDLYQLGKHRLLCGDATSIDAIDTLLQKQSVDMVFTDPPYGISAVSKSGVLSKNKNYRGDILNDDSVSVAKDAYRMCAGLGIPKMIFWGANYYASALPDAACWLVWDKNNGGSDQMDCELAWTNLKGVTRQFTKASEKINRVHPTQKPVELITWAMDRYDAGDILDLFGGSGATLIACEKTKRACYMMELDPHYCDVIVARWEKYTGKKAALEQNATS